ncbi:MAG: ABC transporter ATP-binding protein, partial [Nevskiaceae bacterium]
MLRVSGLEVVYHSVARVASGVSLEVPEGAIVALLGPNGAGKTTVLRAITGLLPIHDGRITKGTIELGPGSGSGAGATRLDGLAPERIVRHGLVQVMEGRRIFIELTVEENLLAGTYGRSDDWRSDLDAIYTQFPRLAERRRQTAGLLSGGEQQMLAIGRALL